MDRVILEKSGIDYDAGVRRFMEDGELYEEMLTAFLVDDCFSKTAEAFNRKDYAALFEQCHAMKGASGNLNMTRLYRASSELTDFLRHNSAPRADRVSELFDRMQGAYMQVINGIRAAGAQ